MSPGVDLAHRVERAARDLIIESVRAAARRRGAAGFVRPLGSGAACLAGPESPLNKVVGLGFSEPVDEDELAKIEAAYDAAGAEVQVELSTLADPEIASLLRRRGYTPRGFEDVRGLRLEPGAVEPSPPSSQVSVVRVDPGDPDWLDVLVEGFTNPDEDGVASHERFSPAALRAVLGDQASVLGMRSFLARQGGAAVGGGSVYIEGGIAQLCGAATVLAHRRQGVQSALLDARLAHAAVAGCDLAVVTTLPGSRSAKNVEGRGFALLYSRAILVRPAPR